METPLLHQVSLRGQMFQLEKDRLHLNLTMLVVLTTVFFARALGIKMAVISGGSHNEVNREE